ncbi:MAG: hypothetical protein EAX86_05305 [Candidatus Heimdallarchaeota archaeon]|nr:hypothetical protein [Candidatus Heimdallarchaeota archaeon]
MILTFEVLVGFLTSAFILIAFSIALLRYLKLGYRPLLFLALQWLGIALWGLFTAISTFILENGDTPNILFFPPLQLDWTLADLLGFIGYFITIPTLFLLIFFLDSITRTSIEPVKMLIGGMIAATLIITGLVPGQGAKNVTIYTYYAQAIYYMFWILLWLYYTFKIFLSSPQNLKRYSAIVLIGSIIIFLDAFLTVTRLNPPESNLSMFLMGSGALMIVIPYSFQTKLLYILPFKATRLIVINDNGIPLFSHSWVKGTDPSGEVLFSGMMSGISAILNESLKKGLVREIALDESKLLIETDKRYSIIFVLQCTRTSTSLSDALHLFSEQFILNFKEYLSGSFINTEKFNASKLVDECFPFLPDYN